MWQGGRDGLRAALAGGAGRLALPAAAAAAGQGGDGEGGRLRALLEPLAGGRVLLRAHDVVRAPLCAEGAPAAPPLIRDPGWKNAST